MNARLSVGGPLLRVILATVLGIAIGSAALVWTRTRVVSLRYELARRVNEHADLRADVEKLRVEVAALSSPDRIEAEARQLGLRYPRAGQILRPFTTNGSSR